MTAPGIDALRDANRRALAASADRAKMFAAQARRDKFHGSAAAIEELAAKGLAEASGVAL